MASPRRRRVGERQVRARRRRKAPVKTGRGVGGYCVNLNDKARAGKVDPLIGRTSEVERCIQISAGHQNNRFFGIPASARRLSRGPGRARCQSTTCRRVSGRPWFALDMGALLAGTLIAATSRNGSSRFRGVGEPPNAILFIDEITRSSAARPAVGHGRLQPAEAALASGRCAAWARHYRSFARFEKDAPGAPGSRRSTSTTTIEDSLKILKGLKTYYEDSTSCANQRGAEGRWTCRPLHHRPQAAGQGHRIIDEAGASQMLLPESRRKKTSA